MSLHWSGTSGGASSGDVLLRVVPRGRKNGPESRREGRPKFDRDRWDLDINAPPAFGAQIRLRGVDYCRSHRFSSKSGLWEADPCHLWGAFGRQSSWPPKRSPSCSVMAHLWLRSDAHLGTLLELRAGFSSQPRLWRLADIQVQPTPDCARLQAFQSERSAVPRSHAPVAMSRGPCLSRSLCDRCLGSRSRGVGAQDAKNGSGRCSPISCLRIAAFGAAFSMFRGQTTRVSVERTILGHALWAHAPVRRSEHSARSPGIHSGHSRRTPIEDTHSGQTLEPGRRRLARGHRMRGERRWDDPLRSHIETLQATRSHGIVWPRTGTKGQPWLLRRSPRPQLHRTRWMMREDNAPGIS